MNVLPVLALDAVVPETTQTSEAISTAYLTSVSMHAILAGSSSTAVTVTLEMTNELTPENWVAVTSGSFDFTSNGQKMLRVDTAYRWMRVVSTDTGSTSGGTLSVWFFGSGND